MQKQFDSIADFIHLKDNCVFCGANLIACISNFYSGNKKGHSPFFDIHINSRYVKFRFNHTTSSYDIRSICNINIDTNEVVFTPSNSALNNEPVNQVRAEQAFESLYPHIELYCPNKSCPYGYYVASAPFMFNRALPQTSPRVLLSVSVYMEAFQSNSMFVQNDWEREELNIFSIDNENAKPIKSRMMDFASNNAEQILNRVSLLVTFY